jgi:hypothetical protein
LPRSCESPGSLGTFVVGAELGSSWLPDLVLEREFGPALPYQPRSGYEPLMIGEELPWLPR